LLKGFYSDYFLSDSQVWPIKQMLTCFCFCTL